MQGLEDAIVDHIKQKSLIYSLKQVESNKLQSINSIKRRLNKKTI